METGGIAGGRFRREGPHAAYEARSYDPPTMALSLPSRVAQVAALALPDDRPAVLGIVGAGGSDAPGVLEAAGALLTKRGLGLARATGRRLEQDDPLGALAHLVDIPAGAAADPDTSDPATERKVRDQLLDRLASRPEALLVDDAHWLDAASLRVLVGVVERAAERNVPVVVAHRPSPGDPALAALDAALARRQPVAVVGPLDEDGVAERAALVLGAAVDQQVVEALAEQAAGVPALVERLARSWSATGVLTGGRFATTANGGSSTSSSGGSPATGTGTGAGAPGAGPSVLGGTGVGTGPTGPQVVLDPAVVEDLRAEVDQLPPPGRTALAALSAGADLDDELLRQVTGLADDELGEAVAQLRAAGLLAGNGEDVVPLVAAAVTALTPEPDRRRFHARLAEALVARGAPPMQAAEHLAAAGAKSPAAAAAYAAAGDALVAESPELAREWFDRAVEAGAPPLSVAARQAESAALDGDTAAALRLADMAAGDPAAADRDRAQSVVAALLPARGLWRRAARVYGQVASVPGPQADAARLLAVVGALVTGGPHRSRTVPEGGDTPTFDAGLLVAEARERLPVPGSLGVEALALLAEGVATSLGSTAAGATDLFVESAELLESGAGRIVLPDTPHAFGSLVALALGEPTTAEHLLARAIDHGVGGPALADRHRLLLGWVGLRGGRWARAQSALDEVKGRTLAPRDVLLAATIEAGLARRAGDLARLATAWGRAEPVLLRQPADLFSLDVIGELAVTANRLGLWERIAGKARELGDVVRSLGEPSLWLLPLRWTGLQVALAGDDVEATTRRAAEVAAVPPAHPRLRALSTAAQAWVAVLSGTVDPGAVQAAAAELAGLGLAWEASRLTGQAAIRSGDPSVTRSLLESARDLKAALPSGEGGEVPVAASVLSEREQMVAQYVVDGLTHKEIGAQLYISPKTVEHHVAKIRQKLGASTRAEMLAALRSQLSE